MNRFRPAWVVTLSWVIAIACHADAQTPADQEKLNTAVEALTRLENVNLDEKPAIRAAVTRVLDKTKGTANFVKLVQHFKLTNQTEGLIETAINNPNSDAGVAAMRWVFASGGVAAVRRTIDSTNVSAAVRVVEAAGNAKEKVAIPLLSPLLDVSARNVELRRAAVKALAQTQEGASTLLELASQEKLPENLKLLAASELNAARWPQIKARAASLLPLPAGRDAQPLPPISELVKMKGDTSKGAGVFRSESAGCIKCHQVRGEGRDVGPALSEIGTKLAKEAIYEAILDPSAGISFGFEAWQVELKSGDEAYGLKVNQTADELAIKDTNGIITRYKASEVASLQQMKTSIMPAGLQATMTAADLVNLVEYLASLKKTSP